MSLPKIVVYTDGSCKPNPGPGGWGAVLVNPKDNSYKELQGSEQESTNNRMELMAPIGALRSLNESYDVEIITDSKYVKNGITKWMARWQERGWLTLDMQEVKNKDLWQELLKEMKEHTISWSWVKGHSDNTYNDLADSLAAAARGKVELPFHDSAAVHMYIGITFKQKARIGGWCVVMTYLHHLKIAGGSCGDTTANRMYIETAVLALKHLKKKIPVYIYTYSGYLRDGAHDWLSGWVFRNWHTRDGREVSNRKQWEELKMYLDCLQVKFILVDKENSPCYLQEAKEMAQEYESLYDSADA
jgi:ribonuclease HI